MPVIAAPASATITIAAGDSLIFLTGGAGIAALQAGSTTVRTFQLGGSLITVGPFDGPRTLTVSVERTLTYSTVAALLPTEPRAGAIVGTPADQVAFGGMVSRAGNSMPQMLTVAAGNSISAQSKYLGSYWGINGELQVANMLAGAPMRFARMAATTRADLWGVYGYSGQTLATINGDVEAQWFAPMHAAGVTPQLAVGLALVENDIQVEGASFATIQKRILTWIRMTRRFPGVRIMLCTPRPSYTVDSPAKVAVWQAVRDYMVSLDNNVDIFTARCDGYENQASPGTPLAGYTDSSVHPNTRGAMANGRRMAAVLLRIAQSYSAPFRIVSNNYALTGSTALTGTNVAGTGPTGSSSSGSANAGAQTITGLAEDPGFLLSINQNAGVSVDAGSWTPGSVAYAGGASTQISTFAEIEVVSGAENLRWVELRPRVADGSGNTFQPFIAGQTGDADADFVNGDVLTLFVPPQIASSGNITAIQPYIYAMGKTGGLSQNGLGGAFSIRVRRTGLGIVVA